MICNEKGVISNSQYFFFTPPNIFKNYYYYLLVCGHFVCRKGYSIQREGGVAPIIMYIISGQLHLTYEGIQYTASKGEIILLDCDKPHTYYCDSSCDFMFFHFDGCNSRQITNHLINQNGAAIFRLETSKEIYDIMNGVITKLCYNHFPTDVERSCAVYNALCYVQTINEILPVGASPISNTMSGIITHIKRNIGDTFTLDSLANRINLSKYYFSHLFKEETGLSPMEYISQTRINLAKIILKTTPRTISDIAIDLGYSSSASFINAFTSRVGISPNKFRNTTM